MTSTSHLRDSEGLILPEVKHTITKLTLRAEDSAAATLAEQYATAIDQAATCAECGSHRDVLDKLGPKLLAVLEALGATPRARAAAGKQEGQGGGSLGKLRAARANPA